jgi:hypothetical protein
VTVSRNRIADLEGHRSVGNVRVNLSHCFQFLACMRLHRCMLCDQSRQIQWIVCDVKLGRKAPRHRESPQGRNLGDFQMARMT